MHTKHTISNSNKHTLTPVYNECIMSHWIMKSKHLDACRVKLRSIPHHDHHTYIYISVFITFFFFFFSWKGSAPVYTRHIMKTRENPTAFYIWQAKRNVINNSQIRIKDSDKLRWPKCTRTDSELIGTSEVLLSGLTCLPNLLIW